jgi:hypothetical protein
MPGYKQYRKQMREFKKQTKTTLGPTTNRERTLSRKKNKRKSKG